MKIALLVISIFLFFLVLSLGVYSVMLNSEISKYKIMNEKEHSISERINKENIALNDSVSKLNKMKNFWDHWSFDNSKNELLYDFRKKKELIPVKGILGGSMGFGQTHLLGKKWIITEFSDGHIYGISLYSFEILPDSTVNYKIIDWDTF